MFSAEERERDREAERGRILLDARGDVKAETELLKTVHFRATATSEMEVEGGRERERRRRGGGEIEGVQIDV